MPPTSTTQPPPRTAGSIPLAVVLLLGAALWIGAGEPWLGRLAGDPHGTLALRLAAATCWLVAGAGVVRGARRGGRGRASREAEGRLQALDRAIASTHDLPLVLGILLDQAIAQLGADAAAVLLLDSAGGVLVEADNRGLGQRLRRQPLARGAAGAAAREARMVRLPELATGADEAADAARAAGLTGYWALPLRAQRGVVGVLELYHRGRPPAGAAWEASAAALVGRAALAIDAAQLFEELRRSNLELALAYEQTIEGWSRALDLRDKETEGHTQRVTELSARLARRMGIDGDELTHLRRGALLHDIGKMGVPDRILLKPAPLSEEEWAVMRLHPLYAHRLLSPIRHLRQALDIPYCHHERWDGGGYPRGLAGEDIPRAARIFAVADVWDALTSDRPYRRAWSEADALAHIAGGAGTHFDPQVVEVFLAMAAEGKLPRPRVREDLARVAGGEGE